MPLDEVDVELPAAGDRSEVARALRDAIARLPAEQRRMVCLKLLLGCSLAEIASLVGISEAAAKMRFQRGLAALRRDLERQGIQPHVT